MTPLFLKVDVPSQGASTTYTYDNSDLNPTSPAASARVEGLDVEVEDVTLEVQDTFLGADTPLDLNETGEYRAQLRVGDTLVVDGSVRLEDITYRKRDETWVILVANNAPDTFWSTLKRVYLAGLLQPYRDALAPNESLSDEVPYYPYAGAIEGWYPIEDAAGGGSLYQVDGVLDTSFLSLLDPLDTLRFIFNEMGWNWSLPSSLWTYEFEVGVTDDTGTLTEHTIKRTAEDVYVTPLENGLASAQVEEITKLAGWRMDVEYLYYPSLGLDVTARPTTTASGTAMPLEGQGPDAWELSVQSQGVWSLSLSGDPHEPSKDAAEWPVDDNANYIEPIPVIAEAPGWAVRAATDWNAAPALFTEEPIDYDDGLPQGSQLTNDDREYIDDEAVEVAYKAIPVQVTDRDVVSTGIDGLQEIIWSGRPFIGDPPYVVERGDVTTGEVIYAREVTGTSTASVSVPNAPPQFSTAWARAPYQHQAQRRAPVRKAETTESRPIDDIKPPRPGDVTAPLSVAGKDDWVVENRSIGLNDGRVDITMQAPVETSAQSALPSLPDRDWTVSKLTAQYKTINRGNGKEDWIFVAWERTATLYMRDWAYRVEWKDTDTSNGWQPMPPQHGWENFWFATAAKLQIKSAGNGGASPSGGRYEVRVRPVDPRGLLGSDLPEEYGTWQRYIFP